MRFFDYIFYKMKWWNTKKILDFSPFLSAIIILAVFQGFNVLFVLNCLKYYWGYSVSIIDKYFLGLPVIFFVINLLRYHSSVKQSNIDNWVLSLTKKSQKIYNLLVILYFIVSLILLIWIGYNIRQQNI
jgi:hypothetical protein